MSNKEKRNGIQKYKNGRKDWWVNGKRHRDNELPAIEHKDKKNEWYQDGKRHRDYLLPAVENSMNRREWWSNGELHRDEGLHAVEFKYDYDDDFGKLWYVDGMKHRCHDLPGTVMENGYNLEWFQCDVNHRNYELPAIMNDMDNIWIRNGYYHRKYGLFALHEILERNKYWYRGGVRHCMFEYPAYIENDNLYDWYQKGIHIVDKQMVPSICLDRWNLSTLAKERFDMLK